MPPVASPPKAAQPRGQAAPSRSPTSTVATLTLSSKNYSSWSLRGWLMARFAGLDFQEMMVDPTMPMRAQEILLLSPSIRVPCLTHAGIKVWDTLAIGEYLAEVVPDSGLLPDERAARAHCRAICGEMHSGFSSLRSALPMNLKGDFPGHKVWTRRARRHRAHHDHLGRVPRALRRARTCSARSAAWPTRCTRRW